MIVGSQQLRWTLFIWQMFTNDYIMTAFHEALCIRNQLFIDSVSLGLFHYNSCITHVVTAKLCMSKQTQSKQKHSLLSN